MSQHEVVAYIGLGSNLEQPLQQVQTALEELNQIEGVRCIASSSLYRSAPLGPPGQADYINAVAAVETSLTAQQLLAELQSIENRHGRVREQHWGPRTLDLDLLLFADQCIDQPSLVVPHPGLTERSFVLVPLFEIVPGLRLPDKQKLVNLVGQCSQDGLERV